MPVLKILPYKMGSESAKLLSQHLEALIGRKVYRIREGFKPKPKHQIINWGSRANPMGNCWNPGRHADAALKLHNVPTVEWTTHPQEIDPWLAAGVPVYARLTVEGQGGAGIKLVQRADEQVIAPLYTKYFSAKSEYRVHVAFGEVIDHAKKKKRHEAAGNKFLRNLANGYVYARTDVELPQSVAEAATAAVQALGLDFGAVDVLHNETKDTPAVLEINTAPGLDNHTAERYARAFVRRAGIRVASV
jgi:hypothetical protein